MRKIEELTVQSYEALADEYWSSRGYTSPRNLKT